MTETIISFKALGIGYDTQSNNQGPEGGVYLEGMQALREASARKCGIHGLLGRPGLRSVGDRGLSGPREPGARVWQSHMQIRPSQAKPPWNNDPTSWLRWASKAMQSELELGWPKASLQHCQAERMVWNRVPWARPPLQHQQ